MYRTFGFCLTIFVAVAIPAVGNCANALGQSGSPIEFQSKTPIVLAATKGSAGNSAGYSCDGLQCTCQGDVDCNDLFGSGKCGDIASCDNDTGICKCLILKKTPVKKFHPERTGKVPLLKSQ